jgi:serine/threonine protein phosphatase PrpC
MMKATVKPWVWQSAQQTHRGKRRQHNEDAVLSRSPAGLWAVADGMGGHQSGDVASAAITAALAAVPLAGPLSDRIDAVEDALVAVNDELRLHASSRGLGATIGSTVVVLVAEGALGAVLWAGDSRLYRLRAGRLEQVTRDHNPISDLLDTGGATEEQALAADTNIITRAVGGQARLFLDVAVFDLAPEDHFLLCSDGLYRELTPEQLAAIMLEPRLDRAAEVMLDRALEGAAGDNISLVLVRREAPHPEGRP